MKLNKKGFGVAEIAIVILLIGILAAAVLTGFMGIKNRANSHVAEEISKSKDIINATKHAYPIVLSDNQEGIYIGPDDYEVYDLNGYTVNAITGSNHTVDYWGPIDNQVSIVNYGGDITVRGGGGKVVSKYTPIVHQLGTTGTTTLDDLTIDNVMHIAGQNVAQDNYATFILGGIVKFHNVNINAGGGVAAYFGSEIYYSADNYTYVMNTITNGKNSRYSFYLSDDVYAEIKGGTFNTRYSQGYILAGYGTEVVIKDGIFKHNVAADATVNLPYPCFRIYSNDNSNKKYGETKVTVEGGMFMGHKNVACVEFSGPNVTIEIKGGEFITASKNPISGTGKVVISGGAFAFALKPEWIAEGCSVSAEKQPVVCRDGVTRNLWVVTKN